MFHHPETPAAIGPAHSRNELIEAMKRQITDQVPGSDWIHPTD